ncbi:MAG: hypothetical protein H6741_28830, partial [Alphaproteobacteria bacterium]|nr:hypothetical protein [Alphaproteobacteria bacterium]
MSASLLLCAAALASEPGAPPESRAVEDREAAEQQRLPDVKPTAPEAGSGLKFLGLVQMKPVATNIYSTNPFLDGQVLGALGGTNGLSTGEDAGYYTEQRASGFFTFAPPILDGKASLSAAFEVDWAWGDQSYGTGGNIGGAFGADMVNLQTRRMHVTYAPTLPAGHSLRVHAGMQWLGDSVNDPTASRPDDLFRSGGRLMFWGSEATGLTAYGKWKTDWGDRLRYRAGVFTLYERGLATPDDVVLAVAGVQAHPAYATRVGVQGWALRDRSNGTQGLFGIGPTSALAELQGANRLDLREDATGAAPEASADLYWLALDASYNHDLSKGPLGASGVFVYNTGTVYGRGVDSVHVRGTLLDGEVRLRWAQGAGSIVRVEGILVPADDPDTRDLEGIITGQSYGIVGAVNFTHGCLLLFTDPFSINRMSAVVYDVSAAGRGLGAVTASIGYDPIPDRLTVRAGYGHAHDLLNDAHYGQEFNVSIVGSPLLFFKTGLHAATVITPNAPPAGADEVLPENPWIVY